MPGRTRPRAARIIINDNDNNKNNDDDNNILFAGRDSEDEEQNRSRQVGTTSIGTARRATVTRNLGDRFYLSEGRRVLWWRGASTRQRS